MLIDTFVNAIFLYDDKMLLTFNFKDGTKTITFEDVNNVLERADSGSDLDCSRAPKRDCRKFCNLFLYPGYSLHSSL